MAAISARPARRNVRRRRYWAAGKPARIRRC
jgi:hypothetical protein